MMEGTIQRSLLAGLNFVKRDCVNIDNLIPQRSALRWSRVFSDRLLAVLPKALVLSWNGGRKSLPGNNRKDSKADM
jgi:hypothetical protein